ncbi:restriction endonuclease subunit S [Streptomyces cinnamoneus]|uniref:restriction endonuclease subunit S n=1 Tax=Streptomyces cinnamoneus TaxID=53446 RepID=UPI0033D7C1FF
MKGWEVKRLGDLCSRITVGHVGSMASRYLETGIPFLRSQNIKRGRIDFSSLKYIGPDFHQQLRKSQLQPGDLAIVRTGEPGTAAVVPDGIGPLNCSDLVIATPRDGVDVRFLCYAINETAQDFVQAHTVGAVQQHFNVASAKAMTLHVPPLAEQCAISAVLGALDDKIAVNERIAATADQLANAIFDGAVQAVSPRPMAEILDPVLGGTPDRKVENFWEGDIPWASVKDVVNTVAGALVSTEECITELGERGSRAKRMPAGSVILTARGTVGLVARLTMPAAFNQSCYAFVPGETPPAVLFHLIRLASRRMMGLAHGTVFSTVNMKTFQHVEIPKIPKELSDSLQGELGSLHELIEANLKQSLTLSSLRDTLLPQLMSGRIRVKDAEKIVEDHV